MTILKKAIKKLMDDCGICHDTPETPEQMGGMMKPNNLLSFLVRRNQAEEEEDREEDCEVMRLPLDKGPGDESDDDSGAVDNSEDDDSDAVDDAPEEKSELDQAFDTIRKLMSKE